MASGGSWEFNCPQFVDFASGEHSPKDDVFSGGATSPGLKDWKAMALPKVNPFTFGPMNNHNRYASSVNYTDSEKVVVQDHLSKRLSKSVGSLQCPVKTTKTPANQNGAFPRLERSLSASELRFKPKAGPATPMCLKRTLVKTKIKKIKTTEELELEKIAQLQMQTKMHLRANELTMMRRRQKPGAIRMEVTKTDLKPRDNLPLKEQKVPNFEMPSAPNLVVPKVNVPKKIHSPQAPRSEARSILTREIERMKANNPRNPLRETNHWNKLNPKHIWPGRDGVNSVREKGLVKSYDAHSGITLFASREKSAAVKSFIFPTKPREVDSHKKSIAAKSFIFPSKPREVDSHEKGVSKSFIFPSKPSEVDSHEKSVPAKSFILPSKHREVVSSEVLKKSCEKSDGKMKDFETKSSKVDAHDKNVAAKSLISPSKPKEVESREKSVTAKSFGLPTRLKEFSIASNIKKWRDGLKNKTCQKSHVLSSTRIPSISGKENFASRSFFYSDGRTAQQPKLKGNHASKISKEI